MTESGFDAAAVVAAWEAYDASLDRLVVLGEPLYDALKAAFAAGYRAGQDSDDPPDGATVID